MINSFEADKFSDIPRALIEAIWAFLNQRYVVDRLKIVSEYGITGVEGIPEKDFIAKFGEVVKEDRTKQLVGYLVKQILEREGFELRSRGATIRFGSIFSRGSKYSPKDGGQFCSPSDKLALK
jgi:hypothetical protein